MEVVKQRLKVLALKKSFVRCCGQAVEQHKFVNHNDKLGEYMYICPKCETVAHVPVNDILGAFETELIDEEVEGVGE